METLHPLQLQHVLALKFFHHYFSLWQLWPVFDYHYISFIPVFNNLNLIHHIIRSSLRYYLRYQAHNLSKQHDWLDNCLAFFQNDVLMFLDIKLYLLVFHCMYCSLHFDLRYLNHVELYQIDMVRMQGQGNQNYYRQHDLQNPKEQHILLVLTLSNLIVYYQLTLGRGQPSLLLLRVFIQLILQNHLWQENSPDQFHINREQECCFCQRP